MLTRIVRISLAVESAAWAAIAAWLHWAYSLRWEWLAVGAIAAALVARLALVCLTCILGWMYRSERAAAQRLGPIGILRLVGSEYCALIADNFWYLPFEAIALRPDPAPPPGERPVVLLVHGYLSNRGLFAPMARWLEARGVGPVLVPSYRSVFSTIEAGVAELHAAIERSCAAGSPRVVLVCHSMGGLLARRYLQEHGGARVARLVTIASPHHGTVLSRLGVGRHARQMQRDSDFLRALARAEAARPPQVPTTSIYSVHDNLVSPQDTSRLAWARNVALAGLGHVAILASERVFALVLEELQAAGAA
jgi:triacylglycerol esterase/lipase EstA (alpha/beta hydrolase family)